MRIVDVCEFYSPHGGGVRSYVDRKMQLLQQAGHELIVLAPGRANGVEERAGGGRIIWIEAPALPFDANYRMFWDAAPIHRELDRLAPDVVEASSPWRPAWIVGKWHGDAAKIFFLHGDPITSYPQRWFGRIASRSKARVKSKLRPNCTPFTGWSIRWVAMPARSNSSRMGPSPM